MVQQKRNQRRIEHSAGIVLLAFGLWFGDAQGQPIANGQPAPVEVALAEPDAQPAAAEAALAQWRTELANLGAADTPAAEAALSAWLDKLLAGKVAKEIYLELLEAAGKYNAPAIKAKLERYQAARLAEGGLACSADLLYGGNAERGRKIFFEKQDALCIKCHKVGHEGGDSGPPLTGATTNRTREFILESIVRPDAKITPGYQAYIFILKDRSSFSGMIKQESETELTVNCPPDENHIEARVITLQKANIASRRKSASAMPDGFDRTLSRWDLRDLVEFVAGLK